jgi:glycosyltransferase involved in cell wall biosynthesis
MMTKATTQIENRVLRNVDAVMVENQEMADHVRRSQNPRVHVAPPGVDVGLFRPGDAAPSGKGYLLSVCRLGDPRKGLGRLVRAYGIMTQSRPGLPPLVLAGRGSIDTSTQLLVRELGLADRVEMRPDVSPAELSDLYREASVFLQTSYEEGLGLSVVEAMASGLSVVATRTAGSTETVLDGVTGWLVDQDDERSLPARFASRTLDILDSADRSFGKAARSRAVDKFSTAATLTKYMEVYSAVLAEKRADGRRAY